MTYVAEHVQALEKACHRLMSDPGDNGSRDLLLEALAAYKAVPMASFPMSLQRMVAASRDQADALCVRILETHDGASQSIEPELREVCHTLSRLAAALPGHAGGPS